MPKRSNRSPSRLPNGRMVETSGVVLALFVLTYLYALSGLDDRLFVVVYPLLYAGLAISILVFGYGVGDRPVTAVCGGVVLVGLGLAAAGYSVGPHPYRDLIVLLVAVGAVALAASDPSMNYGREVALLTTVFGLAVLFGAFPSAGSDLGSSPTFRSVSVTVSASSPGATLLGVELPSLSFSGAGFGVSVHLVQGTVGAVAYIVGRRRMTVSTADSP